jgi:hypothetical protein
MARRISEFVLGCRNPEVLARFWCEVLDFVVLDREDDGSVEIGPSQGFGGSQPTTSSVVGGEPEKGTSRRHIASYGAIGGTWAVEHLRLILGQLSVADIRQQVEFSSFTDFENFTEFRSTAMWGLVTFTSVRGDRLVEFDGPVRGTLFIDAAWIDIGNKKQDTHLRSKDFFDVAQHPSVTFDLERTRPSSDRIDLGGTLSILRKGQPLEFDAEIVDRDATGLTIRGKHTLDRSRWGSTSRSTG